MMIRIYSAVLLLIYLTSLSLFSQPELDTYLENAFSKNAILNSFSQQQKIAELEIQKIHAQYNKPAWAISGDYLLAPFFADKGRVVALTATPDAKAFGYDAGVSNGGWYSAQVNLAYPVSSKKLSSPLVAQQQLAQVDLNNRQQLLKAELKRQITADYINAYLIQQQKDYTQQLEERLLAERELVRKLADRGLMRITDLELLNLEINNIAYTLNSLQGQYRQALQTLNNDSGISDTSLVVLKPIKLVLEQEKLTSLFLESYRLDSLTSVNDQAVFQTRYLPQVNVFANAGLNAVEIPGIYRKIGLSAGIHLSWLFRDGGQGKINAQQNELRRLDTQNQADFAQLQIQNNRENLGLLLQQHQQNIGLLDQQLASYQQLLVAYRQELSRGSISVIDFLTVLKNFAGLQQQKAQLETQLWLTINEINYWNQ